MRASPLALMSARVRTTGQMLRGPVPSGRAAPALCHAHWPVLPAAISAVKTTDRFWLNLCQSRYTTHIYKSPGRSEVEMGLHMVKQLMQQQLLRWIVKRIKYQSDPLNFILKNIKTQQMCLY